jgi:hypothetical protein
MNLRREATKTIWKTVVFAGAMLGGAACGKKPPPAQPAITETGTGTGTGTDAEAMGSDNEVSTPTDPCSGDPADPCADPCGGRPRGVSDEGEGDMGRGFILS